MSLIKCYECGKEISSLAKNCINCGAPKKSSIAIQFENSIGQPIRIGNLEVAQFDFIYLDVKEILCTIATKFCKEFGNGWLLPTKEELNMLYENKSKIGNFEGTNYWSSTESKPYESWVQNFKNGNQFSNWNTEARNSVRVVRSIS